MKKFEGYLICSDWDGTLANKGVVSKENIDAIRYFQENGGLFTISSGRHYGYLNAYRDMVKPNTAVISLCGTLVYDVEKEEKIYEGYVNEPKIELIDKIMEFPDAVVYVCVYYAGCVEGVTFSTPEYAIHREKIANTKIYKIVFITEVETKMKALIEHMSGVDLNGNLLVRSWSNWLEIYSAASSKGQAARLLKERTNSHTLICVGDYENDIDMIQAADIGYAVANAVDNVKVVADRITVDFRNHAIAKIISDIEEEISAKK